MVKKICLLNNSAKCLSYGQIVIRRSLMEYNGTQQMFVVHYRF